jgi:adenine deaminase
MSQRSGEITANIVYIDSSIHYARLPWADGRITAIEPLGVERSDEPYLSPGLVDAHVH